MSAESGGIIKISKGGTIFKKYWIKGILVRGALDRYEIKLDCNVIESHPKDDATHIQIQIDLPGYKLVEEE